MNHVMMGLILTLQKRQPITHEYSKETLKQILMFLTIKTTSILFDIFITLDEI